MLTETKKQRIRTLYKKGVSIKAIAKQVKSDWRTVKKIVEAQKKKQDYFDDPLGAYQGLVKAQEAKNKRRSEVLAKMNSEPPVSGRAIAIRMTGSTIREEMEKLFARVDVILARIEEKL